jgi:hypothetical protein
MAQNKKSFVLYCDIIHTLNKLSDEEAGKLFKLILSYVNDENPEPDDRLLDLTFEPIKQQLKRDLKSYEAVIERNRINGMKGGRPKKEKPKEPKKPSGFINNPENPTEPKKPDNDNDTVNDSESEDDYEILEKYPFEDFWNLYEKKGNRKTSLRRWKKLPDKTKEKIMQHVPAYVKATPDKQFRKNAETYLNQEAWNDEIVPQNSGNKQTDNRHIMRSPQQEKQQPKIFKFKN